MKVGKIKTALPLTLRVGEDTLNCDHVIEGKRVASILVSMNRCGNPDTCTDPECKAKPPAASLILCGVCLLRVIDLFDPVTEEQVETRMHRLSRSSSARTRRVRRVR